MTEHRVARYRHIKGQTGFSTGIMMKGLAVYKNFHRIADDAVLALHPTKIGGYLTAQGRICIGLIGSDRIGSGRICLARIVHDRWLYNRTDRRGITPQTYHHSRPNPAHRHPP